MNVSRYPTCLISNLLCNMQLVFPPQWLRGCVIMRKCSAKKLSGLESLSEMRGSNVRVRVRDRKYVRVTLAPLATPASC